MKTGIYKNCLNCNASFYIQKHRIIKDPKYCSYKCYWQLKHDTPANKGKKGLQGKNKTSFTKGSIRPNILTLREYKRLHYLINKALGTPVKCSSCDKFKVGKNIHWANISGLYTLNYSDWIALCVSCHSKFDERGFYA